MAWQMSVCVVLLGQASRMASSEATLCDTDEGKICKPIRNICNYFANLTCLFA